MVRYMGSRGVGLFHVFILVGTAGSGCFLVDFSVDSFTIGKKLCTSKCVFRALSGIFEQRVDLCWERTLMVDLNSIESGEPKALPGFDTTLNRRNWHQAKKGPTSSDRP